MARYKDIQGAEVWKLLLLTALVALIIIVPSCLRISRLEEPRLFDYLFAVVLLAAAVPFVLNSLWMRIVVDGGVLLVHIGLIWPEKKRSFPLASIAAVETVQYKPWRDVRGYGLRVGRHNDRPCTYYTMRGDRGVLITTAGGEQIVIGSQQPEALAVALRNARCEAPSA